MGDLTFEDFDRQATSPAAPAMSFEDFDRQATAPAKPSVGQAIMTGLKQTFSPSGIVEQVKSDFGGAVEGFRNPSNATKLSLSAPGATVVQRLGTMAAGKMLDEPSTDPWENVKTAAKGVVGDWRRPMSMLTSPAVMEAVFPFATKVIPAAYRATDAGRKAVNAADAARVGTAMEAAAPTLQPGRTAEAMQQTAEGRGLDRIGAAKDRDVTTIEANLHAVPAQTPNFTNAQGQQYVRLPQGGWALARQQGEIPIPSLGKNMTLRDANAELSSIGDQMRGLKPLDPRFPKDANLKVEYGKLANEIRDGIEQVAGPQTAAQWTDAQAQYRAGRNITNDLLERPTLFRQGEFNLQDLQRWLRDPEHRADLARALGGNLATGHNLGSYNRLVDEIQRGAPVGMVDKLAGDAPGILSGRGSYGTWRAPAELVRRFFPNASSQYVGAPGRIPYSGSAPPANLQTLLDLIAERGGAPR